VLGSHGRSVESEESTALEDAIDNRLGKILVVKNLSPGGGGLVGGEDHRAFSTMAIVDHVEEHVGGVGPVGEIADFVDDEQRRVSVCNEGVSKTSLAKGRRELVDELGSSDEERIESVLDGAVSDGDGEMGFPAAGFSHEDETSSLGEEVGGKSRAEEGQAYGRLQCEVEVVDGLEERKAGASREATESGLLTLGDLLGDQKREEIPIGPLLVLSSLHELSPDPSGIGEMEPLQEKVELVIGGLHRGSSCWVGLVLALGRASAKKCAMYSAPMACSARPRSRAARSASSPCWSSRAWSRSTSRVQTCGRR
jgi:hypothetical protein